MMPRLMMMGLGALLPAMPANAHPHIFVDTQIEINFDPQGRADGVRVTWTYDDLTSLQFIADRGLDADFDGALTDAENAALSGFDMDWEEGYAGDTYVLLGAAPVQLSGPSDWTATYQNDKITSSHLRRLTEPVAIGPEPLVVQVYDPTLYSGYYIVGEPKLIGTSDCQITVQRPDLHVANARLDAAIAALPGDAENDFPALGAAFAEEVRVTCAARS